MHQRPRRRFAAFIVTGALSLAVLPGCGGDDPAAVLDRAFKAPIESADVALDFTLQAKGIPQLEKPARFQLRGPYRTGGKERIPSLDFDVSLAAQGQTFTAGVLSTGDNAFVSFRGEDYEVGREQVAKLNQQIASSAGERPDRSLKDLGIDPRRWLSEAETAEDEEIAGTETTHVTAGLDLNKLLEDLNRVAERTGGQLNGQGQGQGQSQAPTLTPRQREQISKTVKDPKFDVYVGKEDNVIRRLSTTLKLEIPEDQRDQAGGAESGSLSFSVEFANVGGDQKVTAPSGARPIQDLAEQVRGLFGGAAGGAGAGGAAPGGAAPGGAAPGAGGAAPGASGGADQQKLDQVRECLAQAGQDKQKQEACAAML